MTCSAGCGERAEHVAACRRDEGLLLLVCREHAQLLGRASREDWWLVPGTALDLQCTVPPFEAESKGGREGGRERD